jgi:NAD+ diphosphatase
MFEFAANLKECCSVKPRDDDFVIILFSRSLVITDGTFPLWKDIKNFLPSENVIFCGTLAGRRCFACECDSSLEYGTEFPVRQFLFEYPMEFQLPLCRAKNLLPWLKQHRFCGACRSELHPSENDSGLKCPECNAVYYPQISPAVIVGITRNNGRELLLAHNRNFAGNMYSLIAGFVEAGESAEAAVHREVWEECGIRVKNIRYVTSQMWPFPNSLMLAFQAEYDSGIAEADGLELSDLGWFTREYHPELPAHGSVARTVIDRIFNL